MKDALKEANVLVGGEAGQGLATVGPLLARALARAGYRVLVTQSYESRIRGGHNTFAVRVGVAEVRAPREAVDVLVALNAETLALHRAELAAGAVVIADQAFAAAALRVPYGEIAAGKSRNVAALAVAAYVLGLKEGAVAAVVDDYFGGKGKAVEENRAAVEKAYRWAAGAAAAHTPLAAPGDTERRVVLNGNQAIALGALSAGVKFCAFYPMTPSTSIPLTLVAHAEEMGVVVEQAEDEVAAINMAVGASYAGAPAMVATSGGGFALMVEGVSLAAMTETPVVVVVAQRPGPATGLPTRTEQADLEFVLRAGHGEFPRAIFAPGTVEECFYLTREAFRLAQEYQGPVFLLTDQFLADALTAVAPFPAAELEAVGSYRPPAAYETPYRRYAAADGGVSPRLLPGEPAALVVADSDEHTEDGHLTEDLHARVRMVRKRLRKAEGLAREITPPTYEGPEAPALVLVSWGSAWGAVAEAAAALAAKGMAAGALHFSQVWPLPAAEIGAELRGAARVICVEGNATGQFARLLTAAAARGPVECIGRYDGLPLTPEYIWEHVE